jgi:hypothetical protein
VLSFLWRVEIHRQKTSSLPGLPSSGNVVGWLYNPPFVSDEMSRVSSVKIIAFMDGVVK